MKSRVLHVPFLVLLAASASCSGGDSDAQNARATAENVAAGLPQSEADMANKVASVPVISARSYIGGSAKLKVTGAFEIDDVIPINTQASYSAGDMTWLQYGASGSELPNALVTISTYEIGINAARGKPTAIIGSEMCTGGMEVKDTVIKGEYQCPDVTSYDPRGGQMGTVDIEIEFTANS